ncbi:MAG: MBL fold metallo-hydrolase, partial [Wenzhouxiangellaceae bacterium]
MNISTSLIRKLIVAAMIALPVAIAAQDFSEVEIRTTEVADGVWALQGAGGNMGLVVGEKGAFLIDDQFAPLSEKILAAISGITDQPLKFVFNTHWHGDHTGGNQPLAEAGALVVAHDNVRVRMSAGQFMEFFDNEVPPAPEEALPVVTFNDRVTFHLGGHTINAIHLPRAHTDGDGIIHLPEANVIHSGDTVFYGMYPFIDYSSGGSLPGMIEAVDAMLEIADEDTRIITGHGGPVINAAQLGDYRRMLATVHERLAALIEAGKTLEEVQGENITADFDETWGQGFINAQRWIDLNYRGLTGDIAV